MADTTNKPENVTVVEENCVVSFIFVMSDENGEVLDNASFDAPIRYLHGHGGILRGLEKALGGRKLDEQFHCEVEPQDAYGLREGEPQAVPKSIFPEGTQFRIGAGMMAKSDDGKPFPLWIVKIDDENVYVDGNHPLAGKKLFFDVQVIAIRRGTEDEIKDGRAHNGCDMCRP